MQPAENVHPQASAVLKSDNLQPHDEADLINFRADAFSRFISAQDLLETVALKPFHTSKIEPPSSFPVHKKKLYEEDATDEQLKEVLQNLGKDDLVFGDLRLMRIKAQLAEEELERNRKELAEMKLNPGKTFTEEMAFQKNAVAQLARLLGESSDKESFGKLKEAMDKVVEDYEEKYSKNYKLQQGPYTRLSVPLEELAPDVKVERAPENYNPRLITSFLDIDSEEGKKGQMQGNFGTDVFGDDNRNGQLYMQDNGDEDFAMGLMNEHGEDQNEQKMSPGFRDQPSAPSQVPSNVNTTNSNENDVNMEDLNQFLADPQGNDDMMGNDMDALMNFGPDNEEGGIMDDDAFNSDFLSQIDHTME